MGYLIWVAALVLTMFTGIGIAGLTGAGASEGDVLVGMVIAGFIWFPLAMWATNKLDT